MKKLATLIIGIVCATTTYGKGTVNLDSLYAVLDAAIDSADIYLKKKTDQISELKAEYRRCKTLEERFEYAEKLHQEYVPFENDSAIAYQYICMDLAEQMGQPELKYKTELGLAYQLANSGFYNEARIHFSQVPREYLKRGGMLERYLSGMNHLYGEMGFYTHDQRLQKEFYDEQRLMRDSLMALTDSTSRTWVALKSMMLNNTDHPEEALRYSDRWKEMCKPGTRGFAIMAFFRSEIYKKTGDVEQQRYWLIQSALTDIRNAIMDQGALWSLANSIIRDDGELDRAYRYMNYSWGCITRFSTHMRSWLVAPILTLINDQYKEELNEANSNLRWTLLIISLLMAGLALALVTVNKKRHQLHKAHAELAASNEQLSTLNSQLKQANEDLKQSNLQLHDANRVKEEYITKFLGLCSGYIDKLESLRIKINRKVKANQYADVLKLTGSQQMKEDELKELVTNFDNVFLHLFPTFVDEFNALLRPDCRLSLNDDGTMTTDMRIFALIRLGLEESSRIAEFLGYSPNSIYNYRARIKNKAIGDREEFEAQVKRIGLVQ